MKKIVYSIVLIALVFQTGFSSKIRALAQGVETETSTPTLGPTELPLSSATETADPVTETSPTPTSPDTLEPFSQETPIPTTATPLIDESLLPDGEDENSLEATMPAYFEMALDETRGVLYGSDSDGDKIVVHRISDLGQKNFFSLPTGSSPHGIALSPDGNALAVALYGSDSIIFLDPDNGNTISTIALPDSDPSTWDVIYGREGRLYSSGSPHHSWTKVHIIDTNNYTLVGDAPISTYGSAYLAISSDKNTLYVNDGNNYIYKLDVSDDNIPDPSKTFASLDRKDKIVLSPNDSVLFTGDGVAWDPDLKATMGSILPNDYSEEEFLTFLPGRDAVAIAVDDVYGYNDRVVFARASNFFVLSIYALGDKGTIGSIAATSDGKKLIISSSKGMISINLANNFPPGKPQPMPKGSTAYFELVADEARQVLYGSNPTGQRVDIISMTTNKVIGKIWFNNNSFPKGMDISPNGNELAVALYQGGVIAFIDLDTRTITHKIFPDTRTPETPSYYSGTKPYDVIYGRPGRLYSSGAPYSSGSDFIHVIDTDNHEEIGRSGYQIASGPWLAISSDKTTLFVNDDKYVSPQKLYKFDVTTDALSDPVESAHADWLKGDRFLLSADERIFMDSGMVWDTSLLGQIGATGQAGNLALLPTHDAIAIGVDTATIDSILFSNDSTFYGIKKYTLPNAGKLGAMTAAFNGNKLFVSSDKSMMAVDLTAGLPGAAVAAPVGKRPYYDIVMDETRGFLYGSDPTGHKIDVISMATLKVVKKFRLVNGATPLGIDLSPDGQELAVAQSGASTLIFLNSETGAEIARIFTDTTQAAAPWEIGSYNVPFDVIYGSAGRLYSSGAPGAMGLDYLHIINTDTHEEIAKSDYYVRSLNSLGMSSDKNTLYVNLFGRSPHEILKIDVSADILPDPSGQPSASGASGRNFALTPDNTKLFLDSGQVWNSDLTEKLGSTELSGYLAILPAFNVVAMTVDQTDSKAIAFFNLSDYFGVKIYTLPVKGSLGPMVVTSDTTKLFVSTSVGIVKVDLSAGLPGVVISLPAGQIPYFDMIADEARGVLYGSDLTGHKIDVISMASQQVIGKYYLVNGASPTGIALSPDGSELAVAQYGASTIVFLDPETGDQIASIRPTGGGIHGPYDVIYGRADRLYSTPSLHVYDASAHTEIDMIPGPGSYPSMAVSSNGNTLYAINTYQSPEYLYRYDIATDTPVKINSVSMDSSYHIQTFALMESAEKILVSNGKAFRSDLSEDFGTFAPAGRVGVIPTQNAFLSAAGKTITFFDANTQQAIGAFSLPGVTAVGPVVVLSDDSALFVTTDIGVKKVNLSVFPPVVETWNFLSVGAKDGWIRESSETSAVGGAMKALGFLLAGDNAQKKQYRSILSFNTAALPDNALITKVVLKIKKQGIVGNDPFRTLGFLTADIRTGYFGTSALETSDFQAKASNASIGRFFATTPATGWYQLVLSDENFQYINLTGVTQFRLRFSRDDNNNSKDDYIQFFSGDNSVAARNRPTLIVEYVLP